METTREGGLHCIYHKKCPFHRVSKGRNKDVILLLYGAIELQYSAMKM